jgi:hypothetical protein
MYTATFHKCYPLISCEYGHLKVFLLQKYLPQPDWTVCPSQAEGYKLMDAHARTLMTLSPVNLIYIKLNSGRIKLAQSENTGAREKEGHDRALKAVAVVHSGKG